MHAAFSISCLFHFFFFFPILLSPNQIAKYSEHSQRYRSLLLSVIIMYYAVSYCSILVHFEWMGKRYEYIISTLASRSVEFTR